MIPMTPDYENLTEDARVLHDFMKSRAFELLLREIKNVAESGHNVLLTGKDFAEVSFGRGLIEGVSSLQNKLAAKAKETKKPEKEK
jgi:hypothetical protein